MLFDNTFMNDRSGTLHLFFSGFDASFLFDVATNIKEFSSSSLEISALSNGQFSLLGQEVHLIDEEALYRAETVARAFSSTPQALIDNNVLEDFHICKDYFLRTVDRVFITPRSIRYLDNYYFELLSFFIGYFKTFSNIDAVIFDASPHFPWDIVLFFVAKYFNIQTRILRRTLIENRVVLDDDFRMLSRGFARFDHNEVFLGQYDDINSIKESFWMRQSKLVNSRLDESRFTFKFLAFLVSFPWLLLFIIRNHKNYRNGYTRLSWISYFLKMVKQKIRVLYLKEWLRKNCIQPDLTEKYVYFAMHFQPERTTDPEAGIFTNQYLAIKLLSETLPDGWKIYVKEHPRQVNSHPDVRYTHFRTVKDYEKIQSLPGTHLVHPTFNSHHLIESCRMTASCTGSTVWEGMVMGKPGLNFGRVWHVECESSLLISNEFDARRAFDILSKKSENDVCEDVSAFLEKFIDSMIVSVNFEGAARASQIPRKILVSNLAQAIVKSLSKTDTSISNIHEVDRVF